MALAKGCVTLLPLLLLMGRRRDFGVWGFIPPFVSSFFPGLPAAPIHRLVPLFLVRSHVDALAAALTALHPRAEGWHLDLVGVVIHVDDRVMAAGVVEAVDREPMHTLLAHITERHWRTRWVLGIGWHGRRVAEKSPPELPHRPGPAPGFCI
jgi:hypothetical protein